MKKIMALFLAMMLTRIIKMTAHQAFTKAYTLAFTHNIKCKIVKDAYSNVWNVIEMESV